VQELAGPHQRDDHVADRNDRVEQDPDPPDQLAEHLSESIVIIDRHVPRVAVEREARQLADDLGEDHVDLLGMVLGSRREMCE
jgi:hypothetical protein